MGDKQPDNQPGTGGRHGRKWLVAIGVVLLAIGLGGLGYAYLGPAGQGASAATGAASGRSILQWAEANGVVLGLILSALGVLVSAWGVFRPAKPVQTSSSAQTIAQHTSGQGNRPTALNQSGEGSHSHVGDVIYNRDPDVVELAKSLGQTQELVKSHLRRLEQDGVPPEKWGGALDKIVEEYRKFQAQAAAFQTDDPETKRLIEEGRELAEQAKFEEAYQKLDQATERELKAADDLDRASHNRKTNAAEVLAIKAHLKNTELEFREAAELFGKAAGLVKDSEEAHWTYLEQAASAWYRQGDEKGDNRALAQAIRLYGAILDHYPRHDKPLDWARIQNNLGVALLALGERETGTERLGQAVAAYEDALKEYTRERVPLDWATTQNNLGGALQRLGEREPGKERFERAVWAYEEALKEWTRERVPLQWAGTQNNLGYALRNLGEREPGKERLEQAVRACEEALKEYTRERVPLDWAATQCNLGIALAILGEREPGTERLEQAVAAYEDALKEYTRERVPLDWATTQNNLGIALHRLGEGEPGTERLDQAVRAFEEALKERTRERLPLQWAMTHNNLGNVLQSLGEREPGTERLVQAVAACEEALKEWTRERVPLDWAATQNNLGNALRELGIRNLDLALVRKAVEAQEAALEAAREAGHAYFEKGFSEDLEESRQALAELQAKRK